MKFNCERCGKKYATAGDPAPGRVYKLNCKACGHLIVVRTSAATAPAPAAPAAATPAEPATGLEVPAAEPAPVAPAAAPAGPPPLDATAEVPAAAAQGTPDPELEPRQGDSGYVDLFSDVASDPAAPPQEPEVDPFLAAARASLPETYARAASATDPFSGLRNDLSPASAPESPPRTPPKVPVIPKPKQATNVVPIALIGVGVAVLVGILAFALLSTGREPTRAAAPAAGTVPALSPPPLAPAPEPDAVARAAPVTPAPPPPAAPEQEAERRRRSLEKSQARAANEERDRVAREAAQREREARARADPGAKEGERTARPPAAAEGAAAEPEGGLTQAQIEGVLRSTKPAFDGCIEAARGGDVPLDGRRVKLRLAIQTTGAVTSPTLDDAGLDGTDLGACLKSAARLMVFPRFKGDAVRVEVPLVMR